MRTQCRGNWLKSSWCLSLGIFICVVFSWKEWCLFKLSLWFSFLLVNCCIRNSFQSIKESEVRCSGGIIGGQIEKIWWHHTFVCNVSFLIKQRLQAFCWQVFVCCEWNSLWLHWSQNFTSKSKCHAADTLVWLQQSFGSIKWCSFQVNAGHNSDCRSAGRTSVEESGGSGGNYPKELLYFITFVFSPRMLSMSKFVNVNAVFPWRKGLQLVFLNLRSKFLIAITFPLFTRIRFSLNDALRHMIVCIVKSPVVPLQTECCAEFGEYISEWCLRAWSSLVPLIVNFNDLPIEHSSFFWYLENPAPLKMIENFLASLFD